MMSLNSRYQTYWYDNNGNMTWRDEYAPGQTYMAFWQGYTPDNKLYIAVGYGWNAGAGQWEYNNVYSFFYYDADGQPGAQGRPEWDDGICRAGVRAERIHRCAAGDLQL